MGGGKDPAEYRDPISSAAISIDNALHQLHEGNVFSLGVVDKTLGNNEFIGISFITPASIDAKIHIIVGFTSQGPAHLEFIETPDTLTGGSAATPLNRDRDSSNTSKLTSVLTYDNADTITQGAGVLISNEHSFAARAEQGGTRAILEFILKPSTTYALKLVADQATNGGQIVAVWFEDKDKTP